MSTILRSAMCCILSAALLSLCTGCAILQNTAKTWYEFYFPDYTIQRIPNYQTMTYMEILNYDNRTKTKRPKKRTLFFYGKLKATEQEGGVKFVIPFGL